MRGLLHENGQWAWRYSRAFDGHNYVSVTINSHRSSPMKTKKNI